MCLENYKFLETPVPDFSSPKSSTLDKYGSFCYNKGGGVCYEKIKSECRGGGALSRKVGRYKVSRLPESVFAPKWRGKRIAFTLAEVLITLSIIGVVAALTMPSLIAKHQQKEGIAGYKKMVSMFNQAAKMAVNDLGYVPECYAYIKGNRPYPAMDECISYDDRGGCIAWGDADGNPRPADYMGRFDECSDFWPAFYKHLTIVKECVHGYSEGCTIEYRGSDTIQKEEDDSLTDDELWAMNASSRNMTAEYLKNGKAKVFADGSIIIYPEDQWPVIDVNGKRGPNKWGYDIFRLTKTGSASRGIYYTYDNNMPLDKGGIFPSEAFLK